MRPVGCLLIGETSARTERLWQSLTVQGVHAVGGEWRKNLLADMQRDFYDVQKHAVRACIAAEGAMWAAALALAVQLSVDRVVLLNPSDEAERFDGEQRRQLNRLRGYVRRNLFFCVSDVLTVGPEKGAPRDMDGVYSRMINARIWSADAASHDEEVRTATHFLLCDDFAKSEYACE